MYQLKNSLTAFIGLCALVGMIAAVTPATSYGSGDASSAKDVNVANTPNVQVVNSPVVKSRQEGPWNVSVNGSVGIDPQGNSVQIANTPSNPVLTREVGAATQPFHANLSVSIPEGADRGTSMPFVVPAGKRLVVEQVSGRAFVGAPGTLLLTSLLIHQQGQQFIHYLTPVEGMARAGYQNYYVQSQQARLQLEAGMSLELFALTEKGAGAQAGMTVAVSGYLVDAP
jgi:hypothetical protein